MTKTKKMAKKVLKPGSKDGRPTKYTQEIADKICAEITMGKSLAKIQRESAEEGIKFSIVSVFSWLRLNEDFLKNYTRAKGEQAELFAEQIIDIADLEMPRLADGKIDGGLINQNRLRVDARKWVASKLKPKKYGDRITTEDITAKEPIQMNINLSK